MPIVVSKFGGSSTANADCLRQVLNILNENPNRRCAVLSAPGTDALHADKVTQRLSACWLARKNPPARRAAIEGIAKRFEAVAAPLGFAGFGDVAARQIALALRQSEAAVLSRGEYLCALLFSRYSGIPMADAKEVICFDGARLDEERTFNRLIALSRTHDRVILPGFYGSDRAGRVRVFPRNGSDITGALAAAGMGAALYENWTDVPGLMTADPSIVPNARLIPQVSYRQMRSLARSGARVLHPACLDPVAMAGIPTRLRCTADPDHFGTLIDDKVDSVAACVVGKREASLPFPAREGDAPEAACLSVFGASRAKVLDAAKLLDPISVEEARDCVRVYVERAAYEMGLRAIHVRVIEDGER